MAIEIGSETMKLQQSNTEPNSVQPRSSHPQSVSDNSPLQPPTKLVAPPLSERTFGQKLADRMASKVGSWGFLIGQTTVLTAWVGCNLMPGLPHWDESPFILLNLVFSFASAYTAPVVLMSQNRQSDEDRAHALQNYQVNLQTAQNLESLCQKMDTLYAQKFAELTELIEKQTAQNEVSNQTTIPTIPLQTSNYIGLLPNTVAHSKPAYVLPMVDSDLFTQVAKSEILSADSSSEQN